MRRSRVCSRLRARRLVSVRVWLRNYDVYIRLWKTELLAPLFEPAFTVIGFGWGVGSSHSAD